MSRNAPLWESTADGHRYDWGCLEMDDL